MSTQEQPVVGLPPTMKACQIIEFNKPHQIKEIPTPKSIRPHEILLKVAAAGVCHSDLEYLKGFFPITLPVTGSHEGTGTVLAVGSSISNIKMGDRVLAGQTFGRCDACEICRGPEAYRHYCENREPMMSVDGRNGAWQEYLVVDGREACIIPDEMSFATAAPLACAGATSWRAVNLMEQKPGEWVAIVGSGGGLGHLAIQFAKAKGLKVIAVDARAEGLALSREMGADVVLDANDGLEKLKAETRKAVGSIGVPVSLVISDHKSVPATAAALTAPSGTLVQVAVVDPVSVPFGDVVFRDIRVRGSFMASQAETQEMLYAIVKHKIKVENNVFKGIGETIRAVEMLQKGQYRGKAAIVIDKQAAEDDEKNSRV